MVQFIVDCPVQYVIGLCDGIRWLVEHNLKRQKLYYSKTNTTIVFDFCFVFYSAYKQRLLNVYCVILAAPFLGTKTCIENHENRFRAKEVNVTFFCFPEIRCIGFNCRASGLWMEWGLGQFSFTASKESNFFLIFKFIIVYTVTIHYNFKLHICEISYNITYNFINARSGAACLKLALVFLSPYTCVHIFSIEQCQTALLLFNVQTTVIYSIYLVDNRGTNEFDSSFSRNIFSVK